MNLRRKLTEITDTAPLHEHLYLIDELKNQYVHSITVTESDYPIENYTCGVHAFYLIEDPVYLEIAGFGLRRTFAGAEFVNFLLQNNLLTQRQFPPLPGDLVIYLDAGIFNHVGRMKTESRVISKWGTGWLYEHDLWEVPASYGEEVLFFSGPDEDASFELFRQYAEHKGFEFD